MTVRHIFFIGNGFTTGNGTLNVEYTGRIYHNAYRLTNFKSLYDRQLDLLIECNSCAKKNYGKFIKIKLTNLK